MSREEEAQLRLFYTLRELRRLDPGPAVPRVYLFDVQHTGSAGALRWNRARVRDLCALLGADEQALPAAIRACNAEREAGRGAEPTDDARRVYVTGSAHADTSLAARIEAAGAPARRRSAAAHRRERRCGRRDRTPPGAAAARTGAGSEHRTRTGDRSSRAGRRCRRCARVLSRGRRRAPLGVPGAARRARRCGHPHRPARPPALRPARGRPRCLRRTRPSARGRARRERPPASMVRGAPRPRSAWRADRGRQRRRAARALPDVRHPVRRQPVVGIHLRREAEVRVVPRRAP